MKNFSPSIFIFAFVLCFQNSYSQDTIYKRNNEKIISIVKEITTIEIRYKKIENPAGPDYVIPKKEAVKIVYANGSTDVFQNEIPADSTKKPAAVTFPKFTINSRDTLFFREGLLTGKIVGQGNFNVKIKRDINPNNVAMISKSTIVKIVYADGKTEFVNIHKKKVSPLDSMFARGMNDARKYYKHSGGQGGVLITSILTGGIVGLVPAIICSSVTPKMENLGLPINAPVKNENYMAGYIKTAKNIKRKRVWGGYAIGVGGAIILVAILRNMP